MISMQRIDRINEIVNGYPVRLREKYFSNNYPEIYNEIITYCRDISEIEFIQKVWHWVNHEPNKIKCVCGSVTSFNKNWMNGYRKFCSAKCSQSDDLTKQRRKNTVLSKYGVDNIAKLTDIKKKQESTNLLKYGHKSSFQSEEVRNKWSKSVKEKWGVEHIFQLESVKDKSKETTFDKWGTEHYVQSEHYKEKLKEIGFSEKLRRIHIDRQILKYRIIDIDFINIDGRILELISKKCGHKFNIHYDSLKRRIDNNYEYCTICNPTNTGQSQEEKLIVDWIKSLSIDVIERDRTFGVELDIYIPSKKIAIEFNGLYWHSELYKDKYSHLNKTNICKQNGIDLIHIWEDDWLYKKDIIKSILLNRFSLIRERIWARKCDLKLVSNSDKDDFLIRNHIQGKCKSTYNLGLYSDGELVSLMTFGKRSINGNNEFELLRFCNKINISVVGSASKLFKYFINNYNSNIITSFADVSQFTGELYKKLGFRYLHRSDPNYWWVVDGVRHHRFSFNKKRLVKEGFDPTNTEVEIMYGRGFYRIFGCGQDKYIYSI